MVFVYRHKIELEIPANVVNQCGGAVYISYGFDRVHI